MDTDTYIRSEQTDSCLEAYTKLIKTYNASVIDKFPIELKNALGKLCFEQAQITEDIPEWRGGKRTVLAKLIENHQKPDRRPIAHYIIGPMNISCHWSKHYEKMIYIFGEYHQNSNECYEKTYSEGPQHIIDYLKQYFLHTHAFIDFYLEMHSFVSPGYSIKFNRFVDRLNSMRALFQKCVDPQTRNIVPACNLSRMHYFDIRQGEVRGGRIPISIFIEELGDKLEMLEDEEDITYSEIKDFVEKHSSILNVFSKATEEQTAYEELWHSQIKNFPLLKQELDRVHPPEIKNAIENFIKDELDIVIKNEVERKILAESSKYLLDLKIKKKRKIEGELKIKSDLEKIIEICIVYNALVIDGYLLARLFKKFNINTEKEEKRRPTDEPEEAHNIIIYAGNGHSNRYRKFLKQLKIEDPTDKSKFSAFEDLGNAGPNNYDVKEKPKYCIDMRLFKQPLFSIWDPPQTIPTPRIEYHQPQTIPTPRIEYYPPHLGFDPPLPLTPPESSFDFNPLSPSGYESPLPSRSLSGYKSPLPSRSLSDYESPLPSRSLSDYESPLPSRSLSDYKYPLPSQKGNAGSHLDKRLKK